MVIFNLVYYNIARLQFSLQFYVQSGQVFISAINTLFQEILNRQVIFMQEMENQRYGRNKSTIVDKSIINSGGYRKKFDAVTSNKKLASLFYEKAKEMLVHRSVTEIEDMYWFDENGAEVIESAYRRWKLMDKKYFAYDKPLVVPDYISKMSKEELQAEIKKCEEEIKQSRETRNDEEPVTL